jgi:hypothetical protein
VNSGNEHDKGTFMTDTSESAKLSIGKLILIPSVITLAVTLLRLIGELQHWSPRLFNREAGGPGAIIGITWLAPIFGIYFALKLSRSGPGPERAGRAILFGLLGIVAIVLVSLLAFGVFHAGYHGQLIAFCVSFALAAAIQYPVWPALFKTLLAYGYAARIPVLIIMFFAMKGAWGTHYDAVTPDAPPDMHSLGPEFFWLAFLPQMFAWVGFTIWSGSLFGSIAAAIARRRKPAAQTAVA